MQVVGDARQAVYEFRALTIKARLHFKQQDINLFGETTQDAVHVWYNLQLDEMEPLLRTEAEELAGKFFVDSGQIWCDIGRRDDGLRSLSLGIGAFVKKLNGETSCGLFA